MKLSVYDGLYYQVIREGEFETLGNYLSNPLCGYLSYIEDESYLRRACLKPDITCVICTRKLADKEILKKCGKGVAIADSPKTAFNLLHNWMADNQKGYINDYKETSIGQNGNIHDTAVIADKGVSIGKNCKIEEYVIVREGVTIGDNVTICAGAVIGTSSNIVAKDEQDNQFLVKQVGKVIIHDNVYIGSHTDIARGSFPYESTKIGSYTTIDNNSEISHNVNVGRNCIITAQCQICGNSSMGDYSRLNPMAIVSNRVRVGRGCIVDIGSVVVNNIKDGSRVAGNFAIEHQQFLLWHKTKLRKK